MVQGFVYISLKVPTIKINACNAAIGEQINQISVEIFPLFSCFFFVANFSCIKMSLIAT